MLKRLASCAVLLALVLLPACGGGTTGVPTPTSASKLASTVVTSASPQSAATAPAGTGNLPTLTWQQVVQLLSPSTVMIRADFPASAVQDAGLGSGTGIVMTSDGYILTNAHVVDGAADITVAAAGSSQQRPARFVGISPCDDLAVIKVDNTQGLKPATFGKSADQQVGEDVAALGYPLGAEIGTDVTITRGIISKLDVTAFPPYESLIQTDAAINPGNSGGPLVNNKGQVVGVNTLAVNRTIATNINFSISIDQAQTIIPDLMKGHNLVWLGMNLVDNTYGKYFGTQDYVGMVVDGVAPGGPAASAGVQPAYLLTQLQGIDITSKADVCKVLRSHQDGDALTAQFLNVNQSQSQTEILQGQITVGQAKTTAPVKIVSTQPMSGGSTSTASAPTPTPAPSSTATGNVKSWNFASDTGDWYTGDSTTETVTISGGTYNVTFKQPGYYDVFTPKSVQPTGDEAIATDVNLKSGYAGVAVRFSKTSDNKWTYYDCWIDTAGEYGCRVDVQDQFTDLVAATQSSAIKSGQVNRLELDVSGTTLDFYINGTKVNSFSDSHVQSGQVGLEAGSSKSGPAGVVSFGNVAAAPGQ